MSRLKNGCSPGIDGITTEHIKHGKSPVLHKHLADIFTAIMSHSVIPPSFSTGIVIPVHKKSTLNPNVPQSYRPITLSTTYSKLLEHILMPDTQIDDAQFGFREGRGTSLACSLLNDTISYFKVNKSPVYFATLDAEKCFDRIWHSGLLYKLIDMIPSHQWLLLYRWYRSLKAVVMCNGKVSNEFTISRGVRQGSILSPTLFNIYINDLLKELQRPEHENGVKIGNSTLSTFAYADDISLISLLPGLQKSIDICCEYALRWRFSFGAVKSQCMVIGDKLFDTYPSWKMNNIPIETVDSIEILGTAFNSKGNGNDHVDHRISSCRRNMYALACASQV